MESRGDRARLYNQSADPLKLKLWKRNPERLSVILNKMAQFHLPNGLAPCEMLTLKSGLIRGSSGLAVAIWETVAQLAKEFANLKSTMARATESTLDKWDLRSCFCCAVGIKERKDEDISKAKKYWRDYERRQNAG